MKQDHAIKKLPLMNKFEARVLIRIYKEKTLSYAHMIQDAMLSKEIASSSEGRRQNFMSEYLSQKNDDDDGCHATFLSQELQELSQRKVLSVITNVEDQSDHNHYILQETVYYMIQEAMLSKEKSSSSEDKSQRFISEYILSKYPSLKNDDDDRQHTTLLSQELIQRKVLSLIINVEDQSANHYILQETLYYENTGAERPTTALCLLLLRAANYPWVVAQQLQGGRDAEDNNDIGIMEKKTRKLKYKSAREINRRMDDGVEGTGINADVEVGVIDDDQVTGIKKDSFRRTDTNTVDEPMDDAGEEVAGEEHQQEEMREEEKGQEEEEYQEEEVGGDEGQNGDEDEEEDEDEDEGKDEEEDDEDEDEDEDDDDEEVLLGEEGEAIVETVLEKLKAMVATKAKAVVAELADEIELEELEKGLIESLEEGMVDEVKERIEGMVVDVTQKIIAIQEAAEEAAALIIKAEEAEKRIAIQEAADAAALITKAEAQKRIAIQEAAEVAAAAIAKSEADDAAAKASLAELAKVEALCAEAEATKVAAEAVVAVLAEARALGGPADATVITAEQILRATKAAADAAKRPQ